MYMMIVPCSLYSP